MTRRPHVQPPLVLALAALVAFAGAVPRTGAAVLHVAVGGGHTHIDVAHGHDEGDCGHEGLLIHDHDAPCDEGTPGESHEHRCLEIGLPDSADRSAPAKALAAPALSPFSLPLPPLALTAPADLDLLLLAGAFPVPLGFSPPDLLRCTVLLI